MNALDILGKYNFRFEKKFGQNFITDGELLEEIVKKSGVNGRTAVLEIGCGAGTLTAELCKSAKFVYGYEIDEKLRPVLKEALAPYSNVAITFADVMKRTTESIESEIGEEYMLVANLPYYITSPLIMKFVEQSERCVGICVMVQEEVAERICAKAGTAEYGAITAGINSTARSEILLRVPREKFLPRPKVDSAVVKITFERNKYPLLDRAKYRAVVRAAFCSRRKTLVNNLRTSFGLSAEKAEQILDGLSIDKLARGETLSAEKFVALSGALAEYIPEKKQ